MLRKAIITGASKGLGKEIAKSLALQGIHLTLISRDSELLQHNIEKLPDSYNHKYVPFDLINDDLNHLQTEFNNCSILINCAGITNHSLLYNLSQSEIEATLRLNLVVPIVLAKLAYKPMLRIKEFKPVIINISSILALPQYSLPGTSVYAALKAGLNGFTKSLAHEFRGKVRVNSILPGLMRHTAMGSKVSANIEPVNISAVVDKVNEVINGSMNGESIIVA